MAKKKSFNKKWILAIVAVLAIIIYYQVNQTPEKQPLPSPGYNLEKTGAGVVLNFTDTASKIHSAVDNGLANSKLSPKDTKEANREVPRKGVEGTIRWHARSMLLVPPENITPEAIVQMLSPLVAKAGGKIIGTEPDTYNGAPVTRIDVGIKDTLNNEPLTLVTDKLYIVKDKGTLPPDKPKVEGNRGKIAILIDDFGYTHDPIDGYLEMGRPISFAVLPYRTYSNEAASRAAAAGHVVMLHLPLEPMAAAEAKEPVVITVDMSDEEIKEKVTKAINSTPGIKGVNNHQGSRATSDRRVMKTVLGVIKSESLFFLDSRTSGKTIAAEVSRQMGIRTGENELFIDNSSDIDLIKKQLRKAIDMAHKNGSVTVIGHARPNTVIAVREMIPEIEAAGIKLVYVNQLLN